MTSKGHSSDCSDSRAVPPPFLFSEKYMCITDLIIVVEIEHPLTFPNYFDEAYWRSRQDVSVDDWLCGNRGQSVYTLLPAEAYVDSKFETIKCAAKRLYRYIEIA